MRRMTTLRFPCSEEAKIAMWEATWWERGWTAWAVPAIPDQMPNVQVKKPSGISSPVELSYDSSQATIWLQTDGEIPNEHWSSEQKKKLKPQKCIAPQFWRLEVQNQCVSRVRLSLKALGEDPSLLLPSFWWFLAILGIPWLVDTLLQSLLPSSHGVSLSMYLCPNFPLLIRTSVIELGHTLIQYDLILAWLHLQGPYFQIRSYSHSYWWIGLQLIFWGTQFNP